MHMRSLLLGFVLIICFSTNAQIKGYVGVKGGGHLSTVYIEHTLYNTFMNTGFIPGYHGGVFGKLFTYQSPSSFLNAGMQFGINYERKGWSQTFETTEPTYKIRMDYINIPIEAIAYAGKGNTKFFFTLGIYTEYLIGVDKDPDPNLDNLGNGIEFYTYESDRDRKFGYGIRTSLGLQHQFPFGALHLDGFIGYSVSSFMKTDNFSDRLPDLTNHYLGGFSLAYLIPFGKMKF